MNNDIPAFRYSRVVIPLTLRQSVGLWLTSLVRLEWKWERTKIDFELVMPGDPGYDAADFEAVLMKPIRYDSGNLVHRDRG